MTEAERLAWIEKLELEAFGQKRPEVAVYEASFDHCNSISVGWVLGGLPISVLFGLLLQSFNIFIAALCAFYVGSALLAFAVSRRSDVWRWYFVGHANLIRLSAIPSFAIWKVLQAAAAGSNDPQICSFASRTWTDYRSALIALGRPVPDKTILTRGFGEVFSWLPV